MNPLSLALTKVSAPVRIASRDEQPEEAPGDAFAALIERPPVAAEKPGRHGPGRHREVAAGPAAASAAPIRDRTADDDGGEEAVERPVETGEGTDVASLPLAILEVIAAARPPAGSGEPARPKGRPAPEAAGRAEVAAAADRPLADATGADDWAPVARQVGDRPAAPEHHGPASPSPDADALPSGAGFVPHSRVVDAPARRSTGERPDPVPPVIVPPRAAADGIPTPTGAVQSITVGDASGSLATALVDTVASQPDWSALAERIGGIDARPGAPAGAAALQIRVHLHPADLGRVTLHLRSDGDELRIVVHTDTESAHRRLMAESDTLIDGLRALGVSLGDVVLTAREGASVSLRNDEANAGREAGQGAARDGQAARRNDDAGRERPRPQGNGGDAGLADRGGVYI